MQSIIDVPNAVCESGGIKRAASPLSPCLSSSGEDHHPLPQHEFSCPPGQVCYHKRLRTSTLHLSLKTQNTRIASARAPPSVVWRDFRIREFKMFEEARKPNYEALDPSDRMSNIIAKTATPFTSTQQSKLGIEPQGPGEYFKPHGRLHNFYTKASIETTGGIIDLERVQVDERSPFNLVPLSVATNLDLMLYSGKTLAITIADRLVQTNQYSQFTIRVAGHNTMIKTGVISGLQTILLGREWIRRVRLLNDFGNQNYFIPVPLAVEITDEKLPNIFDTVKPVEMAKCDETAEEHDDDDEFRNDDSSNGRSSLDDGPLSESEPSFDGQNLLDGDTPSDELLSSGDGTLSDSGTSEVTPTDEDKDDDQDEIEVDDECEDKDDDEDTDDGGDDECDDEGCEDCDGYDECEGCEESKGYDECHDECEGCEHCDDYDECEEREECKGYDECEGCEECEGYDECEGCEECEGYEKYEEFGEGHENQQGEEDTDDNLQDFMEQYTHIEHFTDADVVSKQTKEDHRQQSESKGEPALPDSYHIVGPEQYAMPDSTKFQVSGVQVRITKRQSKEIANILNHISRTPAGQSFKAPVEKLWPEYAGAYATKVSNPIDLGTIQVKVKNNIYSSVNDFRADVVLLYQNSVDFNGIDHIITSTALEVRDTILNALNDMEEGKGSTMLRVSTRVTGV